MSASTPLLLTFLTVAGGRIVHQDDPVFSDRIIVGGTIVVFGVAAANTLSPKLATTFGWLLLVVAFLTYGVDIMRAVGFTVKGP